MNKYIVLSLDESNLDTFVVDSLFNILSSRPEFNYKINAYSLRLIEGKYTQARQYLNSLTKSNQDETDFGIVQNIKGTSKNLS